MKQILVLSTDGTIAMKKAPTVGGAVPVIKGDDLLALLPHDNVQPTFEEFSNIPSSHFTPVDGLKLSQRVESALIDPQIHGVVITHGIDTLEETAYLLDLTLNSAKPVVVTGSTRHVSGLFYDGIANLASAIRVAAAPETRNLGVLVVFQEEIYAASEVQHISTHGLQPLSSLMGGPVGRVENQRATIFHRPLSRHHIPCSRLEESVDLIRLTQGCDARLLRCSVELGVAGVVLEVFGSGRVPPWWIPVINEALSRRTTIAITSRCPMGGLGDEHGYVGAYHDLRRLGVLLVHNLNGVKTRIKLMVALGAARSNEELRTWFFAEKQK